MNAAIKAFQTLYSNSKISLIILKGNLWYALKKCMFVFIKYLIVTKVGDVQGSSVLRVNYPRRKLSGCNYLRAIFLVVIDWG